MELLASSAVEDKRGKYSILCRERRTYCVARLLYEDLRELDHVYVAVERVGKINHRVRGILLLARPSSSKESREGCNGDRVASLSSTRCELQENMIRMV